MTTAERLLNCGSQFVGREEAVEYHLVMAARFEEIAAANPGHPAGKCAARNLAEALRIEQEPADGRRYVIPIRRT